MADNLNPVKFPFSARTVRRRLVRFGLKEEGGRQGADTFGATLRRILQADPDDLEPTGDGSG